ncbi:MAG: nucleotidyltransferase family protein [Candidatus Sungbacteria bacterium]|uniref:Nucleotidyltransferase family protein n=1 Tax=Candidatus Sungiibacteriota bacterium TaxID=2750080 RepID=A0A932YWV0_9BACT|nr:nucleotidyltransferase family protein [Candidatus Sungbacteria bacterium]
MKTIILAGGRGTRLPHSARDIPKALVRVHGKTILDHQLDALAKHGLTDVRLSLGFRADQIIAHLAASGRGHIEYAVESEPLGTGGAVRFAAEGLTEPFLVLNGDTLADFDFSAILRAHETGTALMVSHWREDARDFGLLDVAKDRIQAFLEKPSEPQPGFINAGCYILHPEHLEGAPDTAFMLEQAIFPRLAGQGLLRTMRHRGFWTDLGTEERLAEVQGDESMLV